MYPTGTVTFLFTDIEGSTSLWESYPLAMRSALARHDSLLKKEIESCQGVVVKSTGDGMLAVFPTAAAAVDAAVAGQLALLAQAWPETGPLRVRMGIHSGEAHERDGDYYGPDVNRAARIMSLASGSQVLLSTASAELVRAQLPHGTAVSDLGLHRLRNIEQPEQIFQLTAPGLPQDFPPLASLATANNLPVQTTSFLGRQRESAELQRLLDKEAKWRLVTIVGPGGIGKSRLAIEVAADLAHQFKHGVFFVPLAPLSDDRNIVVAIGDSLQLRSPAGGDLRQGLLDYLRQKELLLVMDNFEHLLSGADIVTDILQKAPGVKILSTSRERLNLTSEAVFLLSGLDYPADARLPAEELVQFDAVRLLLDRARLVRTDLEINGPELAQVARICRLVQGIPLALVLAAGWLELLTFEEVAGEISISLDILESQARDMPERQRSVRAVFDYSWQRLAAEEQQAFSRLAVFRGGFSRRAAQQVAGAGLRSLRTLVGKSLIAADGLDRYAVHELLRQFAEEQLVAAGEAGPIRDAHSHHYLGEAAQREPDLKGRRQLAALEEIEADLENVRAAWDWALERQDQRGIDQAQGSISLFFYMRSRNQEGWALFRQALQRMGVDQAQGDASRRLWGRLTARSALLRAQFAKAAPEIEDAIKESLAIAVAGADQAEIAYAHLALGHYHSRVAGDYKQAQDNFLLSLERYRALNDLFYVAHALHRVGYSYGFIANIDEYMHYTRQSLELARQIGDLFDAAFALGNLGWGSFVNGDYAAAEGYAHEAIALSRPMGDRLTQAHSLVQLGLYHLLSGRLQEAQAEAAEGVIMAQDILYPLTQAYGLAVLSMLASLHGDYELGRRLAAESQELFSNPLGDFLGHWAQAAALIGLDQPQQAWQQALAALEGMSLHLGWDARTTWILPVIAIILARRGQPERASAILGLYFNHPDRPAGFAEKWALLSEWQTRLQEELGTQAYQAAWERGRTWDLVSAVEALLAERKAAS